MILICQVMAAIALDYFFSEPRRYHPLVGFGRLAQKLEVTSAQWPVIGGRPHLRGYLCWGILVALPASILAIALVFLPVTTVHILESVLLYFAIGWQSLKQHALAVQQALQNNPIDTARERVGLMVSRDTQALDERGVLNATIESVLENGSDAIFAAIFWFVILGAPGVLLYRFANTLDAMWGYKSEKYVYFGRAAAILDDILNWLPARLTAASYALMGSLGGALACYQHQGAKTESPNAGRVMAAGAGALNVRLGGSAQYDGKRVSRPVLGQGPAPTIGDIDRAIALIQRSLVLWVVVILLISLFGWRYGID